MDPVIEEHIFESKLFIERNLDGELNGELISEKAFLSYHHFHHQFKDLTGESVWQYVKRLRMERACFLLKYSSIPVTEVAYQVGFETNAAFSKAFKAWQGVAPQKYRNQSVQVIQSTQSLGYDWNQVKTVRQPEQKIYSFRSEGIQKFPAGYFKWKSLAKPSSDQNIPLIGKSPDHPGITDSNKLRWDTAVAKSALPLKLQSELAEQHLIFEDTLPGGTFLKVPFTGFGRPLAGHLPHILAYLRDQGLEWRPSGHFFQVLRSHEEKNKCTTDLYIPVY